MANRKPKYLQKKTSSPKEPGIGYAIPFFVVLAVLSVVSFIIPLRPTVSYIEKRSLAEFPEFSVEALTSGDYFDDISTWFSDTFPGRESWITLASGVQSYHGYSEIMIAGDPSDFASEEEETQMEATETEPTTLPEETSAESSTDKYTDCHTHYIALECKCLKLAKKTSNLLCSSFSLFFLSHCFSSIV